MCVENIIISNLYLKSVCIWMHVQKIRWNAADVQMKYWNIYNIEQNDVRERFHKHANYFWPFAADKSGLNCCWCLDLSGKCARLTLLIPARNPCQWTQTFKAEPEVLAHIVAFAFCLLAPLKVQIALPAVACNIRVWESWIERCRLQFNYFGFRGWRWCFRCHCVHKRTILSKTVKIAAKPTLIDEILQYNDRKKCTNFFELKSRQKYFVLIVIM